MAGAAGVRVETVKIEADRPYEAIISTASGKGSDLIVMASHGRGASPRSCSAARRRRC